MKMEDKSPYKQPSFYNEQGVIAEQYQQLQAIHILNEARDVSPLPKASSLSTIRAILQSSEIALLNINDLMGRAIKEVRLEQFGPLVVKLLWARSFHAVLVRLSSLPQKIFLDQGDREGRSELSIFNSPAFTMYTHTLKIFDEQVVFDIDEGIIPLSDLISYQSLDNNKMHSLHLMRLCNHETTIWEHNLKSIFVPATIPNYEDFVATQFMYNAVYDTMLEGDTYYTQFRGLHQIPEILTAEINDHIEAAILYIREKSLQRSYEHLRCLNVLAEGVLVTLSPIANNLATVDYHNIRENLGLTSGSHSVNIHYHLFKDLYDQLWCAFSKFLVDERVHLVGKESVEELLRDVDLKRFDDEQSFLLHLLADELLSLRAFINEWRELHLHFPRNNIGGDHTKSLTGSSDAVQAVRRMRDAALVRDPFQPLAHVRSLDTLPKDVEPLSLTSYFDTQNALDQRLLETTGYVTKQRFKDVQKRMGVFANKSPFIPPSKREV